MLGLDFFWVIETQLLANQGHFPIFYHHVTSGLVQLLYLIDPQVIDILLFLFIDQYVPGIPIPFPVVHIQFLP